LFINSSIGSALLFALTFCSHSAFGTEVQIERVLTADPVLTTIVNIVDNSGNADQSINSDDITLSVDGVYTSLEEVVRFGDSELPFGTILLIDSSCSMARSMPRVKEAARNYVAGMSGGDVAIIAQFNDDVIGLGNEWTSSASELNLQIDALRADGSTTHLNEALNLATELARDTDELELVSILVLSDGKDFSSPKRYTVDRARAIAKEHGIPVNAVGYVINNRDDETPVLKLLSEDTKGRFSKAENADDIEKEFRAAQEFVHDLWVVAAEVGHLSAGAYQISVSVLEEVISQEDSGVEATEESIPTVLAKGTYRWELDHAWEGVEEPEEERSWLQQYGLYLGGLISLLVLGLLLSMGVISKRRSRERQLEEDFQKKTESEQEKARVSAEIAFGIEELKKQIKPKVNRTDEKGLNTGDNQIANSTERPPSPQQRSRKTKVREPGSCLFGLRILSQPGAGQFIELGSSGQTVMLGTDPSRSDVVLDDGTVSGLHAKLKLNADRTVWVTDEGSSNGTWIGDSDLRVAGQAELRLGDQIQFGTLIATVEVL
jgi:hypothetical protein